MLMKMKSDDALEEAREGMKPRAIVRLAVSIGCPSGIGPEVALAGALAMHRADPYVHVLLVGDVGALRAAARAIDVDPELVVATGVASPRESRRTGGQIAVLQPSGPLAATDRRPGKPSRAGGAAQLAWIDAACDLAQSGVVDVVGVGLADGSVAVRNLRADEDVCRFSHAAADRPMAGGAVTALAFSADGAAGAHLLGGSGVFASGGEEQVGVHVAAGGVEVPFGSFPGHAAHS
jgi:hypothetical protein